MLTDSLGFFLDSIHSSHLYQNNEMAHELRVEGDKVIESDAQGHPIATKVRLLAVLSSLSPKLLPRSISSRTVPLFFGRKRRS